MEQFSLEKYLENPNRKVVTRGGKSVRILCTDRNHPTRPIIALVQIDKCEEMYGCYTKDGSWFDCASSPNDLFFAPVKNSGWINLYKINSTISPGPRAYNAKEDAESVIGDKSYYLSTIKIEWEE